MAVVKIGLPGYTSEAEAAALLGYSQAHFGLLRRQGSGPAYIRRGHAVVYKVVDLEVWMDAKRVDPEAV